jgi:hypothetical protein
MSISCLVWLSVFRGILALIIFRGMSRWNYIASAQRPTAVLQSLYCNFTGHPNLIVVQINSLAVYDVLSDSLHPNLFLPINATILFVVPIPDPSTGQCWLCIVTRPYKLIIVSAEDGAYLTRYVSDLRDSMGRPASDPKFAVNSEQT